MVSGSAATSIGEFITDFFCYELMLVIELDGEIHNSKIQSERMMREQNIKQAWNKSHSFFK